MKQKLEMLDLITFYDLRLVKRRNIILANYDKKYRGMNYLINEIENSLQ